MIGLGSDKKESCLLGLITLITKMLVQVKHTKNTGSSTNVKRRKADGHSLNLIGPLFLLQRRRVTLVLLR